MRSITLGFMLCLLVGACAHHRDVRPGSEGIHRVTIIGDSEVRTQRGAMKQANHFCKDIYKKIAAIKSEKTEYVGDMDESSYRMGKAASRVLKTGGSSAWVFGGKNERNAGKVATGSGSVVDAALGDGYVTKMEFTCI